MQSNKAKIIAIPLKLLLGTFHVNAENKMRNKRTSLDTSIHIKLDIIYENKWAIYHK